MNSITIKDIFFDLYKDRENIADAMKRDNELTLAQWFNTQLYGIARVYAKEVNKPIPVAFDELIQDSEKRLAGGNHD